MSVFDEPGDLGPTRGALLTVLHADWPAYPQGEDFKEALFQLTAFPSGTEFAVIDDIDEVFLLLACIKGANFKDKFDKNNLHIAIWHEDLINLQLKGFVKGVELGTEQQLHEQRWKRLQSEIGTEPIGIADAQGYFVKIKGPQSGQYSDDLDWKKFVIVDTGRISITYAGRTFIANALNEQRSAVMQNISAKVQKLFDLRFFDTCVREACVELEHEMKKIASSDAYGERLIDVFLKWLKETNILESQLRTLRQEIRAVFKLIRNNYMHNLSEVDETSALVILVRIARLRSLYSERT